MAQTEEKKSSKAFISLYVTFCVLFITWLTRKFFRGRRQIHQAFDTIGQQLQRMQEQLDQRREEEETQQLKNSDDSNADAGDKVEDTELDSEVKTEKFKDE